jgi:hypothetical protein
MTQKQNKIIFCIIINISLIIFFLPTTSFSFESGRINTSRSFTSDSSRLKTKRHLLLNSKLLLGFGNTNLNISSKQEIGDYKIESKSGFTGGLMIETSFFNLELGLMYFEKNFLLTVPNSLKQYGYDTNSYNVQNKYLNFILNYDLLSINVNKVFYLTFGFGPYFGFLLSTNENSGLGIKKFDFGIDGRITASIDISNRLSPLIGIIYQYGGLNNMSAANYVNKTYSNNLSFFVGLKIKF